MVRRYLQHNVYLVAKTLDCFGDDLHCPLNGWVGSHSSVVLEDTKGELTRGLLCSNETKNRFLLVVPPGYFEYGWIMKPRLLT